MVHKFSNSEGFLKMRDEETRRIEEGIKLISNRDELFIIFFNHPVRKSNFELLEIHGDTIE
jgi:hypothetical protein